MAKHRRRVVRTSILLANFVILFGVVGLLLHNSRGGQKVQNASLPAESVAGVPNPLDHLSSADIAAQVAELTKIEERRAVRTNADTVNAQLTIVPTENTIASKPQLVATANKSRRDIQTYTTKEGDTVSSLATTFGVTSDSIRWSNALAGDALPPGKQLVIPPINGIVYTVKTGDTADSIAALYKANKEALIAFNDAEVSGLKAGERIVVPDGVIAATSVRTRASSGDISSTGFSSNFAASYGGNGYDYGYCTWWAAARRAQIGRPIPNNLGNASTWKVLAQRAGLAVGNTPATGAVFWVPPTDYYGHVGFVEEAYPDGSARVSEMNFTGWNRVSTKVLSPGQAAALSYIY
jgi:surface antigen